MPLYAENLTPEKIDAATPRTGIDQIDALARMMTRDPMGGLQPQTPAGGAIIAKSPYAKSYVSFFREMMPGLTKALDKVPGDVRLRVVKNASQAPPEPILKPSGQYEITAAPRWYRTVSSNDEPQDLMNAFQMQDFLFDALSVLRNAKGQGPLNPPNFSEARRKTAVMSNNAFQALVKRMQEAKDAAKNAIRR